MQISFAENLRLLRERRGITPERLAAAVGVSSQEYLEWEKGDAVPSLTEARALADVLGVTVDELSRNPTHLPRMNFDALGDDVSDDEKKRIVEAYERDSERRLAAGRRIVRAIIILEVVLLIVSFVLKPSLFALALSIVVLVFLWRGKPAARYIFVVCCMLTAFNNLYFMARYWRINWLLALVQLLLLLYRIAACILMLSSHSVKEFLYDQETG